MNKKDERALEDLEKRLRDIAQGAMAHAPTVEEEEFAGLSWTMGTEPWLEWIGAVQTIFREGPDGRNSAPAQSHAFEIWNLHHFDSFESAAEFLFGLGARP